MAIVNIHEAKTHLSRLLHRVAAGEEIIIARSGEPIARLVPIRERRMRRLGTDRGAFRVPEDEGSPRHARVLYTIAEPCRLNAAPTTVLPDRACSLLRRISAPDASSRVVRRGEAR